MGRGSFCREDRRLRDIGRLMTEVRDSEVRLQTMRQLEQATHHHYRSYQKLSGYLLLSWKLFSPRSPDGRRRHSGCSSEHVAQVRNGHAPTTPGDGFAAQSNRHTRAGERALAKARAEPSAGNIHELRKQTKLLGYQIRLLRPWNDLVVGGVIEELTLLGHLLGRVHDLVFLADRLRLERSESHWGKQDDELLGLVENSEAELQRDGIEIAERFFGERPSKFGIHLDEWFKNWHRTKTPSVVEGLIAA